MVIDLISYKSYISTALLSNEPLFYKLYSDHVYITIILIIVKREFINKMENHKNCSKTGHYLDLFLSFM